MQAFLDIFDIYLLEAVVNGILLGGVLALLALGLNLIFGVIDVTWICYAELVMIGMYGMYYLVQVYHLPYWVGGAARHPAGRACWARAALHRHRAAADRAADQPAAGDRRRAVRAAELCHRRLRHRFPQSRHPPAGAGARRDAFQLRADCWPSRAALVGMVAVYLFMKRTFTGTAIRAIAQDRQIMPLMGVDTQRIYLITSALGGALAGLAACLLVLQYDVHPFVGLSFGPITFLICVLGGLGNFIGGFIAAFVFAEIISLGGLFSDLEWGYVLAFAFFIVMMFIRPAGLLARRS